MDTVQIGLRGWGVLDCKHSVVLSVPFFIYLEKICSGNKKIKKHLGFALSQDPSS